RDVGTGQEICSPYASGRMSRACFSPNGAFLATCGGNVAEIHVFSASTGQHIESISCPAGVNDVWFSPDGNQIAGAVSDGAVTVWTGGFSPRSPDLWTVFGSETVSFRGHRDGVMSVRFSADGERVASVGIDGTVKVWDLVTRLESFS